MVHMDRSHSHIIIVSTICVIVSDIFGRVKLLFCCPKHVLARLIYALSLLRLKHELLQPIRTLFWKYPEVKLMALWDKSRHLFFGEEAYELVGLGITQLQAIPTNDQCNLL